MLAVALDHARPPLPAALPASLRNVIESCWHKEAAERPTALAVREAIDAIEISLTPMHETWLDAPRGHSVYRKAAQEQTSDGQGANGSDSGGAEAGCTKDGGGSGKENDEKSAANPGAQETRRPKTLGWPWSVRRRR